MVQKVGNRSGMGPGKRAPNNMQRPVRRGRSKERRPVSHKLKKTLRYVPAIMKAVVAVIVGITLFLGYRAAASASFFELHTVQVQGAERASATQIEETVKRELIESGVWRADLEELSGKLGHLPWVRSAVVSRVLPDAIRVRIVEREPRGVVRTAAGRFRWVDEDAVLLGEMSSTDQMPAFFLRGLSEEDTDLARKENVERVRKFLELQRDAVAAGFADRISEINLADVRDVRAQLAGNDSQIEVRLGSQDTAKRLQNGLEVLDAQRSGSRGRYISYVDMSQGKRAVVGFVSGAHAAAASTESNREQTALASASSVNSVPRVDRANAEVANDQRKEGRVKEKEKNKREGASREPR